MNNPTNLPDEQFEFWKKTLSPSEFETFVKSQPQKSNLPLKPFTEQAFDLLVEQGRSAQDVFDSDGEAFFFFETKGVQYVCALISRDRGVVRDTKTQEFVGAYFFKEGGDKFVLFSKPVSEWQIAEKAVKSFNF